jgi:hypothetical protein
MRMRTVTLAGLALTLILGEATARPAAQPAARKADQPAAGPEAVAEPSADLDRLSDLVLKMDELRADGADDVVLADARAQIAAELRLDPYETEAAPARGGKLAQRGTPDDSTGSAPSSRQRIERRRVLARAAQILARKRGLVRELRLLQLRIDAGTDNSPVLAAAQDTLLGEYLSLSREETRIGARELRQEQGERQER